MRNFAPIAGAPRDGNPNPASVRIAVRKIYPNPLIAINAVNESSGRNWQIEHQCPRCGAPVLLEETDRILSCGYCRVRLYIRVKDHARYCLAPGKAPARDLFFVPYWRFKGLVFSRTGVEIEQKVIDVSSLALESGDFPPLWEFAPRY